MKRFEFKFEPLLNYREYLERLAMQDTARTNVDIKNCEILIKELENTWERSSREIEKNVKKGIKASFFRQCQGYLDSVQNGIEQENDRKKQLKKLLEKKLSELKKKSLDKRVMEVYKEKLNREYTQERIKTEQKESDEIVSLKTARAISNETV